MAHHANILRLWKDCYGLHGSSLSIRDVVFQEKSQYDKEQRSHTLMISLELLLHCSREVGFIEAQLKE